MAIIWATTTLVFTLYHGFKNRHSADAKPSHVSRSTITRTTRNALFFGSLWAMLPVLFFTNASPGEQVIIACLCAGVLGGGTFVLASVPAAAIAFTAPIVVASAISILRSADPKFLVVAVLMINSVELYGGLYASMHRKLPRELLNRFRLRGGFAATS